MKKNFKEEPKSERQKYNNSSKNKNQYKKNNVRVRFAPSPTGYLHIGSARTAFFNWLFAKKSGGKFILRIEDTDIQRHMEETIDSVMESLKWLGINWDEGPDIGGSFGPYRQSQRKKIYKDYANALLDEKKAYVCFCTPETLEQKRKNTAKDSKFFKYDRECLSLPEPKIKENLKKGLPYAVRLLVPENKDVIFNDSVYGEIRVNSQEIEDFILLRSNGLPTYNFSAAIDDILMEISHVIRGEDHLSNTPKQILIYNAFSIRLPLFTHLPMILGQDDKKLSKRHGSISIESYREEGFLPEAIQNYLALLGWSYDEKTTIFSLKDLIGKFSIENINKKPAKFDYEKLLWLNGTYIRNTDNNTLKNLIQKRIEKNVKDISLIPGLSKNDTGAKIEKIVPLIKERIKTLKEAEGKISPFFSQINYSNKIKNYFKNKKDEALKIIEDAIILLGSIDDFRVENIENNLRLISEKMNINFRRVAEAVRIALWASPVSPPLFGTIEILGKETTLARLKNYRDLIS